MSQNNLKKEFSKSNVQRMRNIITGKSGDKTQIQSGWEKIVEEHKEGDIWEEAGKKWTIKNGIKQTVTKLDSLKNLVVIPLACPKCNKPMKLHHLNKKMYTIHSKCFDCVLEEETKMKLEGTWEDYTKKQMNENKNASLVDFENALEAWMKDRDTIVTEAGDIENWTGVDKTKVYEEIKAYIEKAKHSEI